MGGKGMTCKQAIEQAMDIDPADVHPLEGTLGGYLDAKSKLIAKRAYELGRIAGMREAAKIVDPPPDNPCVDEDEYEIAADWLQEAATQIRERANKLAKKTGAK